MLKSKKKEDVPKLVQVSRAPRGKKKSVTVVSGLSTFGKGMNEMKKRMSKSRVGYNNKYM